MAENTDPHNLVVTHFPLDGPGIRIAGSVAGTDVLVGDLADVLDDVEENLRLTEGALRTPELADLAKSVRGAHLAIQQIVFHLRELHTGVHDGALNYPEDPNRTFADR
jgi:hypothetical protein